MTNIPNFMKAARLHEIGGLLKIDEVPVPDLGSMDVLVRVRSCGIVPNLANILSMWPTWFPDSPQPPFPAVFGLDPTGKVAAVGSQVHNVKPGDRVYVNPGRSCGTCHHCRRGNHISCRHYTFQGYFGFSKFSHQTFRDYPSGGLAEYVAAPASTTVSIPDNMTFDQAARLGYMGTAYSALKKAQVGPGDTLLVNGISGTLGISIALFGPILGVKKILGTGRNREVLKEIEALAPGLVKPSPSVTEILTNGRARRPPTGRALMRSSTAMVPAHRMIPSWQA